jgi:hypothetical protein
MSGGGHPWLGAYKKDGESLVFKLEENNGQLFFEVVLPEGGATNHRQEVNADANGKFGATWEWGPVEFVFEAPNVFREGGADGHKFKRVLWADAVRAARGPSPQPLKRKEWFPMAPPQPLQSYLSARSKWRWTAESSCFVGTAERARSVMRASMKNDLVFYKFNEMESTGDMTRLVFPFTYEAVSQIDPKWLTKAFQKFGSLKQGESVSKIVSHKQFVGGGAGDKCILEVEYAGTSRKLHTKLFCKFPLKEIKQNFRWDDHIEGEVAFMTFFARQVPVKNATPYFADYCSETTNYLVITEYVDFTGLIPPIDKCNDFEQVGSAAGVLNRYKIIMTKLADMAVALPLCSHRACRVLNECIIERGMRYHPSSHGFDQGLQYVHLNRHLFSAAADGKLDLPAIKHSFVQMDQDLEMLKAYLQEDPSYFGYCHFNANMDNAWFVPGEDGEASDCGLVDWGGFRWCNYAAAIWGAMNTAHHIVVDDERELIDAFVERYNKTSKRPAIDADMLMLQLNLCFAVKTNWAIESLGNVCGNIPKGIDSLNNDYFKKDNVAIGHRFFIHVANIFLLKWKRGDCQAAHRAVANAIHQRL